MKSLRSIFFAAMLLLLLTAACASQASSNNGAPMTANVAHPTEALASIPDTGAGAELRSLNVVHPPMQTGSIDRYFDGALLDAVPNGGPFLMGAGGVEGPQHQVTVSDLWIYSTEVSNQMYAWCVRLGKCTSPDPADDPNFHNPQFVNYPVVGVSWQQAADYCSFAHGRLPTEAEWEKAASWDAALNQKRLYPWGDHDPTCNLLNIKYCLGKTSPVTSFGQGESFYGAYNMSGNVFEWVSDWYQRDYYSKSPANDPTGPDSGTQRVLRSGAYNSDAIYASPASRSFAEPSARRPDIGFRCVVKDPTYFAPFCTAPLSYGVGLSGTPAANKPCPDPKIVHSESCSGTTGVQVVTVQDYPPTNVTITGLDACDPPNNEAGVPHTCAPGVTIQVTASCETLPAGQPACPPNFNEDPNNPKQCISPGAPGACPTGFQFDGSPQCCSAIPGNSAAVPLCGVGQHPYGGTCVSDLSGFQAPVSSSFTTFAVGCVAPTPNPTSSKLVPVPTEIVPAPQPTPKPTKIPKCQLRPKDCLFGVDPITCTCRLGP